MSLEGTESARGGFNILFYLEPLIIQERPGLYAAWLPLWARLARALDANPGFVNSFRLITNQTVGAQATRWGIPPNVEFLPVSEVELVRQFDFSSMAASLAWYRGTFTSGQLESTARQMADRLGAWTPDITITSSPVPFLKRNYPDATVLHFEVGMTSRAPFPLSFYLDPLGLYRSSTPATMADAVNAETLDPARAEFLRKYRDFFLPLIASRNPLTEFIASFEGKYRRVVLLPLQTEGFWFNGNTELGSPFQLVEKLLANVPPDVGILVCPHPDNPWITPDIEKYLRRAYPSFLYSVALQKVASASQYLWGAVDAVLGVSSMVGLQALLWKKRVYGIGTTQLKVAADYCFEPDLGDISKLPELLGGPTRDRDNVLAWLLTQFYVPPANFFDPKWIRDFVLRLHRASRTGESPYKAFELIDDPEVILANILEEAVPEIPVMNELPPEAAAGESAAGIQDFQQAPSTVKESEAATPPPAGTKLEPAQPEIFVSYAQNFEDVMLWRALKAIKNGRYIDVGANDPIVDSVTRAFYDRGWRGINIEPVQEWYERLAQDRPEDINLNLAASDSSGTLALYDVIGTGLSTIDKDSAERHRRQGEYRYQKITVPASTLDAILEQYPQGEIHFLKIDVEGAELQVLRGIDLKRHRPWIVLVEATSPGTTAADYADWEPLLTGRAYEYVYFDGLNRFYIAQEHRELREAFQAPPNFFDTFIRARDQDAIRLRDGVVSSLDRERLRLEKLISAKDAERQALQIAVDDREFQLEALETALAATDYERRRLRRDLHKAEARLRPLENEAAASRAEVQRWWQEADKWWHLADQYHSILDEVYASSSWRLTAPMRALHLRDNLQRFTQGVLGSLGRIPLGARLLDALNRRPAGSFDTEAETPTSPASEPAQELLLARAPAIGVSSEDPETRFRTLFQRELSRLGDRRAEAADETAG